MTTKLRSVKGPERLVLIATALYLVDSFIPWYGIANAHRNGWGSGAWAVMAILAGLLTGIFLAARVVGVIPALGVGDGPVVTGLGGGALMLSLLRFVTAPDLTTYGLYFAVVLGAALAIGGYQMLASSTAGLAWGGANVGELVRRGLGVGPIVSAVLSGGLLWIPTHQFSAVFGMSIVMLVVVGGLRIADPALAPVWRLVGKIPMVVRYAAGVGLPILFALSRFGPNAAGREVGRARATLLICTVIAYVFMRPRKADQ